MPAYTILIVDDIPENISTLFDFLDDNEFEVLVAREGQTAIEITEYEQPDLILLDIMMPGISGFETCKRLKENSNTKDIPVIFMTALSETVDKIKGLKLGAVDYVTKPIQQEEVLARINTHLTVYNLQQQLKIKNKELEAKNVELEAKNVELEAKNSELDTFSHTVAHDLKNPLAHMVSLSDLLLEELPDNISEQSHTCLKYILNSSQKMISIVNALLLLAKVSKQEVASTPLNMQDIIYKVQQRLELMMQKYQVEFVVPDKWPTAIGYAEWIEEVWMNYLTNGLKYGGNPPSLEIGAIENQDTIRFWVKDNGSGLSQTSIDKLFTQFTRLHTPVEGHGLGLSIVRHIIEKLGGEVGVESQLGAGCVFYFTLPKA
ncbi:hybrid sensor histidine kinase/response regulator [Candidatus Halobeggiatoa sp. HSG11]|nr:hybrid sensor histidine kinase/response regulator [Candidatus Halobeggiatoa sp. HSG11]